MPPFECHKTFTMTELSTRTRQIPPNSDGACLYHTRELNIGHVGGLMPYGNANQIVKQMCLRLDLRGAPVPVYAGVCGTDPTALTIPFLHELQKLGVTGVQNFPSVGMADQIFRCNLEAVHLAYRREVAMLTTAREMGMEILPFAFSLSDAISLVGAQPKTVVYDLGFDLLSTRGVADPSPYLERTHTVSSLLRSELPGVKVLLHVRDARLRALLRPRLKPTDADGFYISAPAPEDS